MAETARTRAALLALLADNSNGDITPERIRDFLISTLGGFGGIFVNDGVVAQSITTNFATLTGFVTAFPTDSMVSDPVADTVTISIDGTYDIYFGYTISNGINKTFDFVIAVDGTPTVIQTHRKISAGDDQGGNSMRGILELSAGEAITVQVKVDSAEDLTLIHAQLVVERLL